MPIIGAMNNRNGEINNGCRSRLFTQRAIIYKTGRILSIRRGNFPPESGRDGLNHGTLGKIVLAEKGGQQQENYHLVNFPATYL